MRIDKHFVRSYLYFCSYYKAKGEYQKAYDSAKLGLKEGKDNTVDIGGWMAILRLYLTQIKEEAAQHGVSIIE